MLPAVKIKIGEDIRYEFELLNEKGELVKINMSGTLVAGIINESLKEKELRS